METDHPMTSIRDFIEDDILKEYYCMDLALQSDNIWQTKMLRTKLNTKDYFLDEVNPEDPTVLRKIDCIKAEMRGILHMYPA